MEATASQLSPGPELAAADPGLPEEPRSASAPRGRRAQRFLVVALACGGVVGSVARYSVGRGLPSESGRFPWGTFTINITASVVLGFLLVLLLEQFPRGRLARPVIGTGIIGSYSTFSTYLVDALLLIRAGKVGTAVLYLAASAVLGLVAVWIGMAAARLVVRVERWLQEEL